MTCPPHHKVSPAAPSKRVVCPDLIEHVMVPGNIEMLRQCVLTTVDSIEHNIYGSEQTSKSILKRETARTANHTTLMTLFMLLLNVNAQLKETVVLTDHPDKKYKVVRLLDDLRKRLVLDFYTDEEQSTSAFVYKCEDTYIIL